MLQAYRSRMYPAQTQITLLMRHIHACRFVYNNSLEQKIRAYEQGGKKLSCFDLNNRLVALREEYPWLAEVNSQSLQYANRNLDNAFTRFFRESQRRSRPLESASPVLREKRSFPQFKSKKNLVQSFQVPQHYHVDFERRRVQLPKIGEMKTSSRRQSTVPFPGP